MRNFFHPYQINRIEKGIDCHKKIALEGFVIKVGTFSHHEPDACRSSDDRTN